MRDGPRDSPGTSDRPGSLERSAAVSSGFEHIGKLIPAASGSWSIPATPTAPTMSPGQQKLAGGNHSQATFPVPISSPQAAGILSCPARFRSRARRHATRKPRLTPHGHPPSRLSGRPDSPAHPAGERGTAQASRAGAKASVFPETLDSGRASFGTDVSCLCNATHRPPGSLHALPGSARGPAGIPR